MGRAWKDLEREVAKYMRGKRYVRIDYSESAPDVLHPKFSIECKYRAKLPYLFTQGMVQAKRYDPEKVPLLVTKQKGSNISEAIVCIYFKDFINLVYPDE